MGSVHDKRATYKARILDHLTSENITANKDYFRANLYYPSLHARSQQRLTKVHRRCNQALGENGTCWNDLIGNVKALEHFRRAMRLGFEKILLVISVLLRLWFQEMNKFPSK